WLAPADSTANTVAEAYCKVCRSFLRAHLTDLKRHAKTKIHSDNMVQLNPMKKDQSVLSNIVKISNEQKIIDLKLAVYVSTHTSIMSVDHLGEILKVLGKGTALANLKLHRTKCSSLIQNVIAPTLLEELVQDIVSKASEQFPSTIDYLCREVYNWFHISPKRRDEYKQMFDLLNSGLNKKFHNFHQISGTRWLVRSFVVNTILEHWLELNSFFCHG
ncbi:PREDICTED: uncharacterized protein LOC107172562, partial [Diuraphis noxia]